jgi:hypothetical protein
MDRKRLEKISEEALDEEQHAYNILTGKADNYDGADGAREVRRLCGYIAELLSAVKERDDQITALTGDMMQANADLISLREELAQMEDDSDAARSLDGAA